MRSAREPRPDLPRFASTGRASGGLGLEGYYMLLSSKGGEKRQEEKESEKSKRKEEREKENSKPKKKKEGRRETFPYRGKNEHQTGNKRQRGNWQEERKKAKREEVFERFGLARRSAKIAKLGGGKKVRRAGREGPKTKKLCFDWKFPIGGPEKGDFFPVFGFLGPPKPRPPIKNLQENTVF